MNASLGSVQHEAGHFLVGYLLGVLPREYEVPSIQTLSQNRFAEGKVSFVGFEFLGEVRSMIPSLCLVLAVFSQIGTIRLLLNVFSLSSNTGN